MGLRARTAAWPRGGRDEPGTGLGGRPTGLITPLASPGLGGRGQAFRQQGGGEGGGGDGCSWLPGSESPQDLSPAQAGSACSLPLSSLGLWPQAGLAFPRVPGPQPSESSSAPEQDTPSHPTPPTSCAWVQEREGQEGLEADPRRLLFPRSLTPASVCAAERGAGQGREPSFPHCLLRRRPLLPFPRRGK